MYKIKCVYDPLKKIQGKYLDNPKGLGNKDFTWSSEGVAYSRRYWAKDMRNMVYEAYRELPRGSRRRKRVLQIVEEG